MIRYFALGFILSSAIIATQLYFKDEIATLSLAGLDNTSSLQSENTSVAVETSSSKSMPANIASSVPPQNQTKSNSSPNMTHTPTSTPDTFESDELWLSDESDRPVPARYQRNGLIPEPLKFNRQQAKKLNIGDKVSLSIPQTGQAYDMKIQQVNQHQNGTRTLTAEITNTPVPYSVILTEGSATTFATINTPEGTFSLDANGDEAWLIAQLDLDQLIDPNLLDYQIPDMHR